MLIRNFVCFLFAIIIVSFSIHAQGMRQLSFDDIKVEMKGVVLEGIKGIHPFAEGKNCGPYQFFQSDSLKISVKYKLVSNSSRRSSIKDSAIKLKMEYFIDYKGMATTKKSEKIYFLDDKQQFTEKEVFSFQSGRYANTVVRLSYSGKLSD